MCRVYSIRHGHLPFTFMLFFHFSYVVFVFCYCNCYFVVGHGMQRGFVSLCYTAMASFSAHTHTQAHLEAFGKKRCGAQVSQM